jgi:hypothetical protein
VTYVEGPTQRTLPRYEFAGEVQIALIDGPHAYPFPDLEYYYFYPVVARGGLLVIDDIQIPSITRMYEIIDADDAFELLEVVDGTMAIFRRTAAPSLDPTGDGWWMQGYNRAHYTEILRERESDAALDSMTAPLVRNVLRSVSGMAPKALKDRLPERVKRRLWRKM